MKYPNLTAEYEAGRCQLWVYAEHANVTEELMQAILYGDETINLSEALGVQRLLNQYGKNCAIEYLFGQTLAVINPATNKGKARRETLYAKLKQARYIASHSDKSDILHRLAIHDADITSDSLDNGKTIAYAQYRQAVGGLDAFLRQTNKQPPRDLNKLFNVIA